MNIRQLPSGKWNARVYSHTTPDGKRHYRSFTGSTKTEARLAAKKWESNRSRNKSAILGLVEAVEGYIDMKAAILSPSTVVGYKVALRNYIKPFSISRLRVDQINTPAAQSWISSMVKEDYSPKTIRNAYGLLRSVMEMYAPDTRLRVTMPRKKDPELYCPDQDDVAAVIRTAREKHDQAMVIAIMLAAYIPARRGEVCAITFEDLDRKNRTVTIDKAYVINESRRWVLKEPKTASSVRTVELPEFVLNEIPRKGVGRVVSYMPDRLSEVFAEYVVEAGLTHFRFHDLRHFGASLYLSLMSPRYVQDRGGWASGHTMHSVYDNVIDMEKAKQTKEAFQKIAKI